MTARQREAAHRRYQRDYVEPCPHCDGTGRVQTATAQARSKKGGNATYRKSLQEGETSMAERGRKGGRPRALTLAEMDADGPKGGFAAPAGTGVHQHTDGRES